MCGIIAGLIQWIGLPSGIGATEGWIAIAIGMPIVSLGILIAMWAELTTQLEIAGRVGVAYIVAIALAVLVPGLIHAPGEALFYITAMAGCVMSNWLGFFYVLRRLDHRLIKHGTSPAVATAISDQPADSGI
jgi:hypothetical protein